MKVVNSNIEKNQKIEVKQNIVFCDRPESLDDFIGQEDIKSILKSAIISAIKRKDSLGHMLFSGDSGFGKTTLATIISKILNKNIKIITAYAMEKPADMISVLNQLEYGDILFIDEIHRLKPKIEEILYIAMEDFRVDIIMQDENTSIPINKFTLIGATNKLEKLSDAFKNRFIYKFHLKNYTEDETKLILKKYLNEFNIKILDNDILDRISKKVVPVPREIKNLSIKIRDYLISSGFKENNLIIDNEIYEEIIKNLNLQKYGLNSLQLKYLELLKENEVLGLSSIASLLNVDEKVIENDIEPLLLNLYLIEKTVKGRKLKNSGN